VQCVLWYERFQSATRVKREYQRVYKVHPNATPSKQSIKNWHTKFKENGNVGHFQYASSQVDHVLTYPNAIIYDAYSDECTFFLSGKINKQNCRIWGMEKPHHHREHVRDSPQSYCVVLRTL
jgi:hypothetical protein